MQQSRAFPSAVFSRIYRVDCSFWNTFAVDGPEARVAVHVAGDQQEEARCEYGEQEIASDIQLLLLRVICGSDPDSSVFEPLR